jgi:hypothetical protein
MKCAKSKVNSERLKGIGQRAKVLCSESGIALVMVIVLSAIALAIMAALLYMVTSRSEISGLQKRYRTSLEAGMGGASLAYQFIGYRGDSASDDLFDSTLTGSGINHVIGSSFITTPSTCVTLSSDLTCTTIGNYQGLATKLKLPTKCWSSCDYAQSINTATGHSTTYDFAFKLPGASTTYNVYAKITDTVLGNSAAGEDLSVRGVTEERQAQRQSIPYLYTMEVDSENPSNPSERGKLSILYQY